MEPVPQRAWSIPHKLTSSDLVEVLAKHFSLQTRPTKRCLRSCYDTFDWRLFRNKQLLERTGHDWILKDFEGRELAHLKSPRRSFRFAWDFPNCPLREALTQIIDIRALIEIEQGELYTTKIQIIQQDMERVATLHLQRMVSRSSSQQLLTVGLGKVSGQGKWFKRISTFLGQLGLVPQKGADTDLRRALKDNGREPLDYDSGYHVPLHPAMQSIEAVSHIYRSLLGDIRQNQQGVIDDTDTEFLHDLRVATRRTRSALSLIKDVLAPAISDRFKSDFRYIGEITGPVRDLDVYLLSEEDYKDRLVPRLHEGLNYFFMDLKGRRGLEQRKLAALLQGKRLGQILNDWQEVISTRSTSELGKNSNLPIADLARKIIRKRFQRVLQKGRQIQITSPDSELHNLRIDCKKLRYCLEFFSPLHPRPQIKQLIKQLKSLQNNLGEFNDISVQQAMLASTLSRLRPGTTRSLAIAASLGGLMTALSRQHEEVRAQFGQTFSHFCRQKNLDLFQAICGPKKDTAVPL